MMTSHPESRRRPLRILIAFFVALFLPLALVGAAASWSSGARHESHRTWTVQVGSESHDRAIQGMAFLPGNIWINAHDTIRWRANAAEVHTVTFLASGQTLASMQPFNPFNPKEAGRVGGSVYDGTSYFNSGAMSNTSGAIVPTTKHYRLTFPEVGAFTYWCLVHGVMMKGTVHVRPAGTHYPFTQGQYDRQGASQARAILRDGFHLWKQTAEGATNHRVLTGNVDSMAMVMRFVRQTVFVHVGQKVVFENIGMAAPHTVTFGAEPANPFLPVGDPTSYSGGQLNSGVMRPGSHFTVTFTKTGTYRYICALHDFMGMVGKVVVKH